MWVYTRIIRPMGRNLIDQRYELRTLVGSGGMADVYRHGLWKGMVKNASISCMSLHFHMDLIL